MCVMHPTEIVRIHGLEEPMDYRTSSQQSSTSGGGECHGYTSFFGLGDELTMLGC